jgi:PTH1 family peptidyl-tRNA hydrolase
MIKLIVGLGNPGQQYEKTRHNAGFLFLEQLACDLSCSWTKESRFQGWWASGNVAMQKVMLLKPATFMNHSGQSVGAMARYHKINPDEILVVHDELDFEAGLVKLKKGGGHAGHNGLRDIIAHLGSNDFYRLRIGIGRPVIGKSVADYVLSVPSKVEIDSLALAVNMGRQIVDTLFTKVTL